MRRIVVWFASTVTIVVLLFGYHTSTNEPSAAAPSSVSSPSSPSSPSASSPSSDSSRSAGSSSSATPRPHRSTAATTYTGAVAQTRWGPVQVQITVAAGKITTVTILQQPSGNPRDTEINAQALPVLVQDTISAQSAKIDMVSGATVTSEGYVQSLQAALDKAGTGAGR